MTRSYFTIVHRMRPPAWALMLFVIASLLLPRAALASTFNVNPIRIHLSEAQAGGQRSQLLAVRNTSKKELRFQVQGFAWRQSKDGTIQLAPTRDIVFYPRMLKLGAGEKRNIRIGLSIKGVASKEKGRSKAKKVLRSRGKEGTYRVIVQELPSQRTEAMAQQVQVLTRMSVPIFVAPRKTIHRHNIENARVQKGTFRFDLKNHGTVHAMLSEVMIAAKDKAQKTLFKEKQKGWYLLAGGTRSYKVDVPAPLCRKVSSFSVQSSVGKKPISLQFPVSGGACGPQKRKNKGPNTKGKSKKETKTRAEDRA